jgi:tetratricopeptide (TPR) repeat protein
MESLATQYYIKAKDNYPYNLEEMLESLNYALSYDEEHAASHCLMGVFHTEQSLEFHKAINHFELALVYNDYFVEIYYHYSTLLIQLNEFTKAVKLLTFAKTIKGVCISCIVQKEALIFEKKGKLKKAKQALNTAISLSLCNDKIEFLNGELKRVKAKLKRQKTII